MPVTSAQSRDDTSLMAHPTRHRTTKDASAIRKLIPRMLRISVMGGMVWSLIAGIVGALGAFGVLLAFGAKGTPAVVMAIVFAGAPVVNAHDQLGQRAIARALHEVEPNVRAAAVPTIASDPADGLRNPEPIDLR